jgi:UDP-N-acetylmuramoylalanine--D-glutamate ligase
MTKLKELENKKIVILGFGREGKDTLKFLKKNLSKKETIVLDPKKDKGYEKELDKCDIIIKSPGIPFKILPKKSLSKITSQTEIFLNNCQGKVIGITGTKGKSTTTSMIYDILKKGGFKAYLLGNIGKPALSFLPKIKKGSLVVFEMSSFQLTNIKTSPHIAVLLDIFKEHLDYYNSFKEYIEAKSNITRFQNKEDYLIYNSQDLRVEKIAKESKAKKIPIEGKYYHLDMEAAKKVGEIFGISKTKIEKTIRDFKFLPHRMELIGKYKGIEFYNDSLSTIPEAAILALDLLEDKVQTLIVGGYDRGLNFKELAKRIDESQIENLILFPKTGKKILKEIKRPIRYFLVKDMDKAVSLSYQYTQKERACLLSPASPSFGIFKDYADRGDSFKKFVKKYKNAKIKA